MTATTTDLRTLTQIRWEVRGAAASMDDDAVDFNTCASRAAAAYHRSRDAAAYIDAVTAAGEWALIADERAGRRAAA